MIEEIILTKGKLDVVHPYVSQLLKDDHASFTTIRRGGLGASDASIYLGVNKWKTVDELIAEKLSIGVTSEELEVSNKEVVRKGSDLEPIILGYFTKNMGIPVHKPEAMYRLKAHPQLTINFDGVAEVGGILIPVEAKFCSMYANKYWDRSKMITNLMGGAEYRTASTNIIDHIEEVSKLYGIPPYYYTQIQQQMLGLDAPFGYFQVIFDKGWEPGTFKIYRDSYVINCLIEESAKVWARVEKRKTDAY